MGKQINLLKAKDRLSINQGLLGITFSLFVFIIVLNPELLNESFFLPIQLTLAIPLFLSATFAQSKLIYAEKKQMWENYGFITFILGYSFLINIVGTLLSLFVGTEIAMFFFLAVIITPIVYSTLAVIENRSKLKTRIVEDTFFITIILLGGILPSLGIF